MAKQNIPNHLKPWIDARKRFRLSDTHVQMARELGLNPKKLGKLANHRQEPWKTPLPQFIEHLYQWRFNRGRPDVAMSIEKSLASKKQTRLAKKARNAGTKETIVGVAWYAPEQWLRLRDVAADPDKLDQSYPLWLKGAEPR